MAEGIVPDGPPGTGRSWPALIQEALPRLAASTGTSQFPECLIDALRFLVTFDWWMVMIYRERANPEMLCENFTGSWRARPSTHPRRRVTWAQ